MRTIRRQSLALQLVVSLAVIAASGNLFAQPGGVAPENRVATGASGPTLSELQTRLKRAQSDGELEPAVKQQVIELSTALLELVTEDLRGRPTPEAR